MKGKVKSFNPAKGYGFIDTKEGDFYPIDLQSIEKMYETVSLIVDKLASKLVDKFFQDN